jgi:hypothetical protein
MSHTILSHNDFFFNLGAVDRMTLIASKPLHDAYVKATPEQRRDLRQRAVLNYVMGKLHIKQEAAEKILEQSRSQRTAEHEKVVNAASKKAAHHLVRDFKDSHAKTEPKVVKVDKVKVKAAVSIAEGMTKAEFNAWLSAVRAAVSFE